MAKTRKEKVIAAAVKAAVAADDADEVSGELELQTGPDDAALLTALAEIEGGDEVRWNVTRLSPAANAGYCITLGSSELKLETLADELGPGKYRIRGTFTDGTFAGGRTITIAEETREQKKKRETRDGAPKDGGSVSQVLAEIEARRSAALEKWMPALVAVGPALIAALFGNKGPSLTELTAALGGIKALQPAQESQLDTFLKGLEAAKALQPDKGGESNWLDVVRDVAGPLLARAGAPGAAVPEVITHPQAPTMQLVRDNQSPGDPMLQLMGWLRATLATLIEQARKDKDPALYAEVTLDNVPDGIDPAQLRGFIERADWWLVMQQFNAGVTPYEGWFTRFRAEVLDLMNDAAAGGDPDASGGDVDGDAPT